MTRHTCRGSIPVQRAPKDGQDGKNGLAGLTIRTTAWASGVEYRNDISLNTSGIRYLDIAVDKPITLGVSNVHAYVCKKTHTSNSQITLGNTTYWEQMNSLGPLVTALILTAAIKAEFIDVADLASNSAFIQDLLANNAFIQNLASNNAFINNLQVKHLNGADGTFTGAVRFPFRAVYELTGWTNYTSQRYALSSPTGTPNVTAEASMGDTYLDLPSQSEGQYNGFMLTVIVFPRVTKIGDGTIIIRCPQGSIFTPKYYDIYGMKAIKKISTSQGGVIQLICVGAIWYVTNEQLISPTYSESL